VVAVADEITEIGLATGMCYGMCPVYTVTLERSGAARFEGKYFVALMGPHEAAVEPGAFADLARAVEFLGYGSLEPGYKAAMTDTATDASWVVRRGVRQEVANGGGAGPDTLAAIENLIDELASTLDWRPAPVPPRREEHMPIFVGSDVRPEDLPFSEDDPDAHWTQRRRRHEGDATG